MVRRAGDGGFLTIDETARILRISRKTVERMLKTGRLKGINLSPQGGTAKKALWRIPTEEVEKLLRN